MKIIKGGLLVKTPFRRTFREFYDIYENRVRKDVRCRLLFFVGCGSFAKMVNTPPDSFNLTLFSRTWFAYAWDLWGR
jgi:hypothetical protein